MKRFVWRLQRVLDIKKKEEQRARAELFELTERLAEARGELLSRQKMLEEIIRGLTKESPQKRLGQQEFFLRYSAASDEQVKKLKDKILAFELQQKEKVAEVLKLRRFKQGLEQLRVETKRQFIKEQEMLEQKELDERASVSFVRNTHSQERTND
ncbi:MAG: flagellar export protein FliJ [Planctomycetota bacterium]|jgi:flagellar biosynthesis chaperone FliJ